MTQKISFQKNNYKYIVGFNNNTIYIEAFNEHNMNDYYYFENTDYKKFLTPPNIFKIFSDHNNDKKIIEFPELPFGELLIIRLNIPVLGNINNPYHMIINLQKREMPINNSNIVKLSTVSKKKKTFIDIIKKPSFFINTSLLLVIGCSLIGLNYAIYKNLRKLEPEYLFSPIKYIDHNAYQILHARY